jgi:hypothetical protein
MARIKAFLENPTVIHPLKQFPVPMEITKNITVFTDLHDKPVSSSPDTHYPILQKV